MADEPTTAAPVDASAPAGASEPKTPVDSAHTNGENAATQQKEEDGGTAAEHAKVEEPTVDGETAEASTAGLAAESTPLGTNGKDKKRKSTGGVPEHKNKKLSKKKSTPSLHLDCQPGEFYWARLKGYPPWPAIICDEEMLPMSLLASRPVSTARPDGSLRDDFKEGGKNAKERTFPIMFLATNEFQWMVNTALTPLEPEDCLKIPNTKMTKALQQAYQIASEGHDIHYFKDILKIWQDEQEAFRIESERLAEEAERKAAEKAAKAEAGAVLLAEAEKKPKKQASRKSKGGDEDVEMEDAEAPKSTKKRKKEAETDADAAKPKKTPKVMKLNGPKTPGTAETWAKSNSKPKKKVVQAPKAEDEEEKPQMTKEERLQQREKAVLYLRHRLQKGFLSRDTAPKEEEMAAMADFFAQLETYDTLEPSIIRQTKIHKVLKAIVKLASVPKEDQFNFKKRSTALLEIWNKRMEADGDAGPQSAVEKEDNEKSAPASEAKVAETNGTREAESEKDAQKEVLDDARRDAEQGAATSVEGREVGMEDAEASEKPAETAEGKMGDEAAEKMEKVEEAEKDLPVSEAPEEKGAEEADGGDVSMQPALEQPDAA